MSARTVALVLAALLAFPAASASWGLLGSIEPDTPDDVAGGRMPAEPDTDPSPGVRKVYFNAIAKQGVGPYTFPQLNPNVLPGGRIAPPEAFEVTAYLGFWKDCNDDGYVGMAQSAVFQYHASLLDDTSICPPATAHHRGGWVQEFLWIGDTWNAEALGYMHRDPQAAVWGDIGRPGVAEPLGCDATTFPPGTTSRTGGLIGRADCLLQYRGTSALATADDATGLGLRFDDPRAPQNDCDHPLNQPFGLYRDARQCDGEPPGRMTSDAEPVVNAFDCYRRPEDGVRDPTNTPEVAKRPDGSVVWMPQLAPRVSDEPHRASIHRTYNDTFWDTWGSCLYPYYWFIFLAFFVTPSAIETSPRNTLTNLETAPDPAGNAPAKRSTDFSFAFYGYGAMRTSAAAQPYVGAAPYYGGLHATEDALGAGYQSKNPAWAPPTYTGPTVRGDGTARGPVYATFYAKLGPATLGVTTAPPAGSYASESCAGMTGVIDGWDCDAANWWSTAHGAPAPVAETYVARPGDAYHLRDVDCYDGTLATGIPARASLVELSAEGACA